MWATRRLKPLDTFGRVLDFGRNERLGWLLRFTVERRDPLATAGMGLVADYGSDGSSSDSEEEYPDAGGRVELIAHVEDTGETRGVEGETRGVDGEKATSLVQDLVEFPQHKASIVLAGMADIKRDSGATLEYIQGKEMTHKFDGHANCFIETGGKKAMLIDFNYEVEPLPGRCPYRIGPLSLLKETRVNHLGKLAFRWTYWNVLMPGHSMPVPVHMSMSGKAKE